MKRYNSSKVNVWLIMAIITLLPAMSCQKLFDLKPQSSFSEDFVFDDPVTVKSALLGVYAAMVGDQAYGSRLSFYYTNDDDAMITQGGELDGAYRSIGRYTANITNSQLLGPFNKLYTGIERANICIKKIPAMNKYTNGTAKEQAELKRMYGEALTLRAQFYFELIRNWGDVPAPFVPSSDTEDLFFFKTDRDVVYDRILDDLKLAEDLMPWRTEVAEKDERLTKGATKALRARIALFRGGFSLRRETHKMERRSDYLKYYVIARDECSEIMARPDQHTLNPSYIDVFKGTLDAHKIDTYGEIMFEVALAGGTSDTDGKLGNFDGIRVNGNGQRAITVIPTYYYSFDRLDTRKDVTIAGYDVINTFKISQTVRGMTPGKFRRDWITNPSIAPDDKIAFYGVNWPIIRFSDVLLMYAEAVNEIQQGATPAAVQALEEVKKRGFGANAASIGVTPTSYSDFFNAVMDERWHEFGGEGIRKHDLIRWNKMKEKLDETRANLQKMALKQAPYENLPSTMYFKINSTDLIYYKSPYEPTASPVPPAAEWKNISWVTTGATGNINDAYIAIIAQFFKQNHSELLPLHVDIITANPNLKNDCGCTN